jgi:curved DNA-binding protein CbpA
MVLNYYGILGLAHDCNAVEIRWYTFLFFFISSAYKSIALVKHPDKNSSPTANQEFIQIKDAYMLLRDDVLRRRYDLTLPKPPGRTKPRPPKQTNFQPPKQSYSTRKRWFEKGVDEFGVKWEFAAEKQGASASPRPRSSFGDRSFTRTVPEPKTHSPQSASRAHTTYRDSCPQTTPCSQHDPPASPSPSIPRSFAQSWYGYGGFATSDRLGKRDWKVPGHSASRSPARPQSTTRARFRPKSALSSILARYSSSN